MSTESDRAKAVNDVAYTYGHNSLKDRYVIYFDRRPPESPWMDATGWMFSGTLPVVQGHFRQMTLHPEVSYVAIFDMAAPIWMIPLDEFPRGLAKSMVSSGCACSPVSRRDQEWMMRVAGNSAMMVVGALYDWRVEAVSSGWLDSIKSVYRTVSSPVTWINKNVAKGLKKLEPAVTIAATAVATAYGGPAAGAAAAQLTGPILDSSSETGGDPTRLFDDVKRQSGGDPEVDQAVDTAKHAVAQTAAAYHLTATAADASEGDQDAAGKISQLEAAAAGGDDAAATAMRVIAEAFSTLAANRAKSATATSVR